MAKVWRKLDDDYVDHDYLSMRQARYVAAGFPRAKWIDFCIALVADGCRVRVKEAFETKSKYVVAEKDGRSFKVRFSDHQPNRRRELAGDCDFFVGHTHTGVRTTTEALAAARRALRLNASSTSKGCKDSPAPRGRMPEHLRELIELRQLVRFRLNAIWKLADEPKAARERVYAWFAALMGTMPELCHVRNMTEAQCREALKRLDTAKEPDLSDLVRGPAASAATSST